MESETIETFFNTRCKVGAIVKDEATTSKKFYIEADFGFFDTPRQPRPFVANKEDCYSYNYGKVTRYLFHLKDSRLETKAYVIGKKNPLQNYQFNIIKF